MQSNEEARKECAGSVRRAKTPEAAAIVVWSASGLLGYTTAANGDVRIHSDARFIGKEHNATLRTFKGSDAEAFKARVRGLHKNVVNKSGGYVA